MLKEKERERSATKEMEGLICLSRRSKPEKVLNFALDVGDDDVAVNKVEEEQVNEAQQRFCRPFRMSVVRRKQKDKCLFASMSPSFCTRVIT
jgi:hypothetical protein